MMSRLWALLALYSVAVTGDPAATRPPLRGAHVCNKTVTATETVTVRYEKEYKYREEVWCGDITKGFRCTEIKTGRKPAYREEEVPKDSIYFFCCPPYMEEDSESGDERRCVEAPTASPQPLHTVEAKKAGASFGTGGIVGVVMVALALVLLVGAVLYYRRKYMSEKDPAYPTVTYHNVSPTLYAAEEAGKPRGWENNEFDNPMYGNGGRDSTMEVVVPPVQQTKAGKEEPVYAEASAASSVASGAGTSHYEVADGAPSPSFSTAPTTSPYDRIPPQQKLAY